MRRGHARVQRAQRDLQPDGRRNGLRRPRHACRRDHRRGRQQRCRRHGCQLADDHPPGEVARLERRRHDERSDRRARLGVAGTGGGRQHPRGQRLRNVEGRRVLASALRRDRPARTAQHPPRHGRRQHRRQQRRPGGPPISVWLRPRERNLCDRERRERHVAVVGELRRHDRRPRGARGPHLLDAAKRDLRHCQRRFDGLTAGGGRRGADPLHRLLHGGTAQGADPEQRRSAPGVCRPRADGRPPRRLQGDSGLLDRGRRPGEYGVAGDQRDGAVRADAVVLDRQLAKLADRLQLPVGALQPGLHRDRRRDRGQLPGHQHRRRHQAPSHRHRQQRRRLHPRHLRPDRHRASRRDRQRNLRHHQHRRHLRPADHGPQTRQPLPAADRSQRQQAQRLPATHRHHRQPAVHRPHLRRHATTPPAPSSAPPARSPSSRPSKPAGTTSSSQTPSTSQPATTGSE